MKQSFPNSAQVYANSVHNGKLYAGVIPKAQVYRYESDSHWTLLGCLASRPDYADDKVDTWRRVTSLVPYQGKLFTSTSSCKARSLDVDPDGTIGRVYALQAGQVVSHEWDIGSDWTHLSAVREEKQLRLYVDGQLSHSSESPSMKAKFRLWGRKSDETFDFMY